MKIILVDPGQDMVRFLESKPITYSYYSVIMLLGRLTCMFALAATASANAPLDDSNARLFAHLMPVFQREEELLVADRKRPVLNGATYGSLEEASARVAKLMESGIVPKEKGERLMHSLQAAAKVRKLASLLDVASH